MNEKLEEDKKVVYERELKELHEKNGHLTPEMVLKDAKKVSSPLHDFFCWDDSEAAKLYRLGQARQLIASIKVVMETNTGEQVNVRAYYNIIAEQEDDEPVKSNRIYVSLNDILKDEDKRAQVIQYAWNEIQYWNSRYKVYKEFSEITSAIEKVGKKL